MGTDHQSSLSQDLPRSRPINPSSRWITNWFVSSPLLAQPSQESLGKWTRDRQRPVPPHALTSVPQPVLQYAVCQLLHLHHHHHHAQLSASHNVSHHAQPTAAHRRSIKFQAQDYLAEVSMERWYQPS